MSIAKIVAGTCAVAITAPVSAGETIGNWMLDGVPNTASLVEGGGDFFDWLNEDNTPIRKYHYHVFGHVRLPLIPERSGQPPSFGGPPMAKQREFGLRRHIHAVFRTCSVTGCQGLALRPGT